ncbi:TPA: hypothetical protein ACPSKE_001738 [Legionella feeleii]|uniref:Uncharacterized protein n=1 Tax=Legionella feeleii TaxID=453 RepID=A0A0W0U0H0_9GAMM|nr:hypothetical protein [Legionella feeleii]KTD01432.1 hypothetical protein Lfee_1036 [Legionella feeleii]SPX61241.1 Uncharacterised protein [Legionella feeleii]STX38986.1 Uncharacterised protein [Legionella feeleii]
MYSDELFDHTFNECVNEWNNVIVPYYNNFLDYIKNCDPRSPMISRYIEQGWTHYAYLHRNLAEKIYTELKMVEDELSPQQKARYNELVTYMKDSLTDEKQTFNQIVQARKRQLNNPIPMPIFEEQIESNQIFPDNSIYHCISFE